jgi:uncharacterized protein YbbK (DUF523 family)
MSIILTNKIRLGISACAFGCPVRYNGRGWDKTAVIGREREMFSFAPLCPEVLAGLGVPRDSIKLSGGHGQDFWQGQAKVKNSRGRDVSLAVRQGAEAALASLRLFEADAFVFMEGSPSCGVYRTTLKDKRLGKPPGIFGSLLLNEKLFLIPAEDLQSPLKWWDWKRRLLAFVWLKNLAINNKKDLLDAWHHLKFLCQELDRPLANTIGHDLANLSGANEVQLAEEIRTKILLLLRQPSTEKRIRGQALKHYQTFTKRGVLEKDSFSMDMAGKQLLAAELNKLERRLRSTGHFFGSYPVIYRRQGRD